MLLHFQVKVTPFCLIELKSGFEGTIYSNLNVVEMTKKSLESMIEFINFKLTKSLESMIEFK